MNEVLCRLADEVVALQPGEDVVAIDERTAGRGEVARGRRVGEADLAVKGEILRVLLAFHSPGMDRGDGIHARVVARGSVEERGRGVGIAGEVMPGDRPSRRDRDVSSW